MATFPAAKSPGVVPQAMTPSGLTLCTAARSRLNCMACRTGSVFTKTLHPLPWGS